MYTSGGPLETSTYTSGGYAQPLATHGYVTKDGTHLSTTGNVVGGTTTYTSSSQVKNNQSYQTSIWKWYFMLLILIFLYINYY